MNLRTQAVVVIAVTAVLYVGALGFFGRKLGPIRTGLVMMAISFIPLLWQHLFTDSKASGLGFVLFSMLLLPGLLIFWGTMMALTRNVRSGTDREE